MLRVTKLTVVLAQLLVAGTVLAPSRANAQLINFDYPGATQTSPSAINSSGQIVGRYFDSTNHVYSFLRSVDGLIYTPIDVPFAVPNTTQAFGINDLGVIVGTYQSTAFPFPNHGFIRSASGVHTTFDVPQSTYTDARGINNSGQICGAFDYATGRTVGFLRSADGNTYTSIDLLSNGTSAYGINSLGAVVGATYPRAFLRSADGQNTTIFDFPGSATSTAGGINTAGEIVGTNNIHGCYRSSDGSLNFVFDYPGAAATFGRDINDSGLVVGGYQDASNHVHGFVGFPTYSVPEPSSIVLAFVGAVGLGGYVRRRRP